MKAIDRKALRDLWQIKGQVLAIASVIAAGVAMYIMSLSNFESLRYNQETYYERYNFAEVFAGLKRAPLRLAQRVADIPGVAQVSTRVVVDVTLDVAGMTEPVVGRLISLPAYRQGGTLNDVALLEGRRIEPRRPDEVLVHRNFARAHGLGPGDSITAIINGRRRKLEIVGIVLSPEYVYTVRPGDILPDEMRFGIFWMNRKALATAFDMEGGFNDLSLTLMPEVSEPEVIARLDRLLEPYGGLGAMPRRLQLSHWWLDDQLNQLEGMGKVLPLIFLGVGALLLTVVLNRMIAVQRSQIASLKALGYSNFEIGRHYMLWGMVIAMVGAVLGVLGGIWMGQAMLELQGEFYSFPYLEFRVSMRTLLMAALTAFVAAGLGTMGAVRRAVKLPPAEAMRAEPPGNFHKTWVERVGLGALMTEPLRIILRNLQRRPWRAFASVLGISFGGALIVAGSFSLDGMDKMLDVQFNVAQRHDVSVIFVEPRSSAARHELARLPGVIHVEEMRSVPVRLRFGHRSRQAAITGLAADARLNRVIDSSLRPVTLPPEGLVLSAKLAELLAVIQGDTVVLEVLEGSRPARRVLVTDVVDEFMGMSAYMEIDALRRMMREGSNLSGAYLQVDEREADKLYRKLKTIPAVAGVSRKAAAIESFNKVIKDTLGVSIFFNVLFACIITVAVVYNTARISLSERSHELASLRVLGFTRAEISIVLLGELAILTFMALPVGLVLGYLLSLLMVTAFETELYRIPLVITSRVLAFSAITVLTSSALSALLVRRRLDRLDLVEVLKTRE
jgi:putative ABC transport system permease protein